MRKVIWNHRCGSNNYRNWWNSEFVIECHEFVKLTYFVAPYKYVGISWTGAPNKTWEFCSPGVDYSNQFWTIFFVIFWDINKIIWELGPEKQKCCQDKMDGTIHWLRIKNKLKLNEGRKTLIFNLTPQFTPTLIHRRFFFFYLVQIW